MQLDWHADIPSARPRPRNNLKIHGQKYKVPLDGILLASEPIVVRVHYHKEMARTLPCHGKQRCYMCSGGFGGLIKGYMPAVFPQTRQPFVMEFTENALRQLRDYNLDGNELRGAHVILRRTGKGKQGCVEATFLDPWTEPTLFPEFDPRPALLTFWGLESSDPQRFDFLRTSDTDQRPLPLD